MDSNIKIEGDAMQAVVTKAIMEGLSQDDKLSLVEQAIQYLVTAPKPSGGYYGGKPEPTPLQFAFEVAVREVSVKVVREVIKEEEIDAAIYTGIRKALEQNLKDNRGWLTDLISDSVAELVKKRLDAL